VGYAAGLKLILNGPCDYRLLYGIQGIFIELDTGQLPERLDTPAHT